MTTANVINYEPPPTIRAFIKDYRPAELFYDWIVGPVGSGKTTGIFFKLVRMAGLQAPGRDGIRRTRAVIVRNTMPQLRDTTLSSWGYWFKHGQAGRWEETPKRFTLRYNDVECEVLFRALDTAEDVARVLSLEVTFAIVDEFVELPREIIDALSARCGRYPSKVDGGATNWGMWGSSNPSTEDNWWYDHLHSSTGVELVRYPNDPDAQAAFRAMEIAANRLTETANARYFLQPSGFAATAENVENLPGGRAYYTNQAVNKSEAWIKQFLEAEWGYSIAGKPVVPTFSPDLHIAKRPLIYNKHLPLVIGMDPGLGGSALIFGQEDLMGRLNVLGELVQSGYGAERLIKERLKPYLRRRFPDAQVIIAPDPAAGQRSGNDEQKIVDTFRKHYAVRIETNNRLPQRIDAIEHFTTRLVDGGGALLIDPEHCPTLIRALKGGWRYVIDAKRNEQKPEPEKNAYSHPGDGFGYLCRHFHRTTEREARYTSAGRKPFVPPRRPVNAYHFR